MVRGENESVVPFNGNDRCAGMLPELCLRNGPANQLRVVVNINLKGG